MAIAEERGFYYVKLGTTYLTNIEKDSFRITEELNKIPSFEIELANCADNRTAIAAGITDVFRIYRRICDVDTLMFTGIINGDAIEYLSLERLRIIGYASYIDLNWRFHQHLNSGDAENVDCAFDYDSGWHDYTTEANNDAINDVLVSFGSAGNIFYIGQQDTFFGAQVKYSTKGVHSYILESMDSVTGWDINEYMTGITLNTTTKIEGSGALNLIKASTDGTRAGIFKVISTADLTSANVKVWLYLKDETTRNKIAKAEVVFCDSLQSSAKWYFSSFDVGWNLLTVDTNSTPDYNDGINFADVTVIELYANTNQGSDTYVEGDIIGDYFHFESGSQKVIVEYSKGGSVWSTLDVLDETRAFTEDPGTYYITIPHKPGDWAKQTVNGTKKFWIRIRLISGSYTTQPKLDRIKITNTDVYRVYYFDTHANTIMDEVLEGTGYSMDAVDVCPSDQISIVAEYETKLRIIAGVANALTWDDSGDKKAYQWWIDTSKKVHFKQKRGDTLGDITSELTILNNVEDYFNLSNLLWYLGNYDGLNQLRAVVENTASQDTHGIRELAVHEERHNNYTPLKEAAEKAMTYTKAPLQKIAATVTTKYWLDNAFEVGDTVTLHKDEWNVTETAFQIVRADIGPRVTNIDMGISQEHLDGLKAGLQRQLDISGIRMHGSTSLLQFGPETMNYQRVDDSTVYYSKLKFEIPSGARYIHKILVSWKLGNYRADVTGGSESEGHSHTGHAGAGGAFTPDVLDGGAHTPTELSKAHAHLTETTIEIDGTTVPFLALGNNLVNGANHLHGKGRTGPPDDVADAITDLDYGKYCGDEGGYCIQYNPSTTNFAKSSHWHHNSGLNTEYASPTLTLNTWSADLISSLVAYAFSVTSDEEDPAHAHTINYVADHPHTGVAEPAHSDHVIQTEPGADVDLTLGIVEEPGGTVMQLTVNGEDVTSIDGDGTDIVITGFCNTGSNTIEIAPILGSNTKGGATLEGRGIVFIEAKKF